MQTIHKINPAGTLQHLAAENLFDNSEKLIFDAKSGVHIGYHNGQTISAAAALIVEDQQLSLFDSKQLKLF